MPVIHGYNKQQYRGRGILYAAFNLKLRKNLKLKTATIFCTYTRLMFNNCFVKLKMH